MDEKEVQCKMEAITGKPQTETEFVTSVWQRIFDDMRVGKDKTNKRLSIICVALSVIIFLLAGIGFYALDKQQDKFLLQVESLAAKNEKQQKDFLDFLNQYELAEYSQDVSDGGDANFIGRDGDITGGEPKDKNTSEAER